jgi:hypothetical protein
MFRPVEAGAVGRQATAAPRNGWVDDMNHHSHRAWALVVLGTCCCVGCDGNTNKDCNAALKPGCTAPSCENGHWVCPEECDPVLIPGCVHVACVNGAWFCPPECPPEQQPGCVNVTCLGGQWFCPGAGGSGGGSPTGGGGAGPGGSGGAAGSGGSGGVGGA